MPTRVIHGGLRYNPTAARGGSGEECIFRMRNLFKRGGYWEVTGGALDLSETIPAAALTGTLAVTAGSRTVTGSGTAFLSELRPGQFILLVDSVGSRSALLVVDAPPLDDTHFTASAAPTFTASGKPGYRLPVIFAVDAQRGTALRGNVVRNDRGTLFSVGDGTLRLDGSPLSASLALSKQPKVSLYNSGTYTHFALGLPTPSGQSAANVAGGTKGMQAGSYSLVVTAERAEYTGYGNPSARVDVTLAAGERVEFDFGGPMDATSGQSAWGLWATRYVDSLGADKNYLNGPWFRLMAGSGPNGQILASDLTGTKIDVEWLDAEIEANDLVTFDNDPPPDASFVSVFNGIPVWISCAGLRDTAPGPFLFPAKPSNVEAAPAGLAQPTSPPETIVGAVSALGRIYLLTSNHLQVASGTPDENNPVVVRPFWKAGFKNPYQLDFINGVLYGNTTAGPSRSVGDGDEQEAEKTWAVELVEYSRGWVTGHVMVRHDPLNNAICYFHSADSLNEYGFWTTRVWAWGLSEQEWIADIVFTSPVQDSIVSGVATVGDYLEFLMGGRKADNTVEVRTYRFDAASVATDYYLAAQLTDSAEKERAKQLGPGFSAVARITNTGTLKVYGARPTQSVSISDLEAGTNALATVALSNAAGVVQGQRKQARVKNLKQHTVRLGGGWDGTGPRDRVEEIVYEYQIGGARR